MNLNGAVAGDIDYTSDYKMQRSLTTKEDQEEIQEIIRFRDKNNNGMSRKEVISTIMEMISSSKFAKAGKNLEFLIATNRFPELKRGGRTMSLQKTTTKRSQITIEQQLRWYALIESMWNEQKNLNSPAPDFEPIKAHFMCNVDKTSVLDRKGTIRVLGDSSRKKHEKVTSKCHDSVTIVRVGNAGGTVDH